MTLTYYDREIIEEKVEDARKMTSREIAELRAEMRAGHKTQQQLLEAFNRMTVVLEGLAEQVKGLRADLNPQLDKPVKLPAPKAAP